MVARWKKGDYVEDSTKGKSLMKPRKRKGDVLTQVWLDSRKLAMLSDWLDKGGRNTRFMSEVVKFTLDEVIEHLLESGEVEEIKFTDEARKILERKYRTNLNPGDRGRKNLLHNMVLDDRERGVRSERIQKREVRVEEEEKDNYYGGPRWKSQAMKEVDWEQVEERIKEEEEKELKEEVKRNVDKLNFDDEGVSVRGEGMKRYTEEDRLKDSRKMQEEHDRKCEEAVRNRTEKMMKGEISESEMTDEEREELRKVRERSKESEPLEPSTELKDVMVGSGKLNAEELDLLEEKQKIKDAKQLDELAKMNEIVPKGIVGGEEA